MSNPLSPNAQAILLLTAPLIAGRGERSTELVTPAEYKRLARFLHEKQRQPADLLAPDARALFGELQPLIACNRLERLLGRGFLLSQAVERWQARAIWVVSRADAAYPRRLKMRLRDDAPPVLYGCGEAAILDTGGLAVVGSREVNEGLVEYTEGVGRLAARAGQSLVSGGARGIDQAAMRGALEAGGKASGVLADSLEREALNREHRNLLREGQLVLVSPYDPLAGFNVGHAMQRNKLIYALADAALVVSSDYEKGGTWAGAVEQIEKLRLVPVYVRANGEVGKGMEALRGKGALPWPNPETPEAFMEALAVQVQNGMSEQKQLAFSGVREPAQHYAVALMELPLSAAVPGSPAESLFAVVRAFLERMDTPKSELEVAAELQVSTGQAKVWIQRLVKEGVLQRLSKPTRYHAAASSERLL